MQFSFTRFYYLFIKQWKENKKAYTLGIIALPLLMGVACLFFAYTTELTKHNQEIILGGGMVIFGGIFCATLLSEYTPKPKGIRSLTLPTSVIEKLLVAVIYGLIIYPILYLIVVYPVLLLVNYIDYEIFGNLYLPTSMDTKDYLGLLLIVTSILSFVLFCSLCYRKFIFIKASLTFLIFIFILFTASNLINKALIGNSQPITFKKEYLAYFKITEQEAKKINFELLESGPFSGISFNADKYALNYISPSDDVGKIGFIIFLLISPVMLTACYYRLKETEL